ncbi:hypothetical protein MINS_27680 [Mycolicibacterium insubricum]|nr:hypothetical protein MINS_27680 [Mycolicibacterium insubricum]
MTVLGAPGLPDGDGLGEGEAAGVAAGVGDGEGPGEGSGSADAGTVAITAPANSADTPRTIARSIPIPARVP